MFVRGAAALYSTLVRLRVALYRRGYLATKRLGCRVISVGNLTVGGTGKTTVVIALARMLLRKGWKVGILLRGYRGKRRQDVLLVSDGTTVFHGYEAVGEEAVLLSERLPGVPVAVGKDRYRAGRLLLESFPLDGVLLDDGFQHLALARDLDLLLIDVTNPFGNGCLLPAGSLREPVSHLSRAHAILLTRAEQGQRRGISERIAEVNGRLPVFHTSFHPTAFINLLSGEEREVDMIKGRKVLSFSGIGNPASFRFFLHELGGSLVRELIYPDHHPYASRDLEDILSESSAAGAECVVTTEKDGVKVKKRLPPGLSPWALRIDLAGITAGEGQETVWETLLEAGKR